MNRKAVKKYIDKINALNNSIMDDEAYSEMETDLLESYARFLLAAVVENQIEAETTTTEAKVKRVVSPPPVIPSPVVESSPSVLEEKIAEPKVEIAETKIEPPKEEAPIEPVAKVVEEVAPVAEEKPAADQNKPTVAIPELEELFEFKAVKELSDRLRMQPIKDLTTAISINERIFTVQELFGGDKDKFQSTISKINGMASYDDAKSFLINGIAKDNEWYSDAKHKKAAQFIQLVKRRFSAN